MPDVLIGAGDSETYYPETNDASQTYTPQPSATWSHIPIVVNHAYVFYVKLHTTAWTDAFGINTADAQSDFMVGPGVPPEAIDTTPPGIVATSLSATFNTYPSFGAWDSQYCASQ